MSHTPRVLAAVKGWGPLLALAVATVAGGLTLFRAEAQPPTIDLDSARADLTVYGDDAGDVSAWSLAAGDINGDGTDDLIIGAYRGDPAGGTDAGETYVIYGAESLPATIDFSTARADLTVYGDDAYDYSGWSVAAGDINGDTTDDLIISACRGDPAGGTDAGETYVIYGGESLPPAIDLDSARADLTVYGDDAYDYSGWSVAAGDIDGDTTDDLIIGAHGADPAGGTDAGETYVIYGGDSLPATIDLSSARAGLTVYGDGEGDASGQAVAVGDLNGDTTDDLIVGAPGADPAGGTDAGQTYVVYGGGGLPAAIDLDSARADLTVHGPDAGDYSGSSVAARDVDGDTTDDLIIGAHKADGPGRGSTCGAGQVGDRCDAGETYVLHGASSLPGTIDLSSSSADLTVYGADAADYSGYSVAVGDIDGDAAGDLIIGAYHADPPGDTDAGETYVVYGSRGLPATIDLSSAGAGLTIYGGEAGDGSGFSVASGDIDGDTTDDLLTGAPGAAPSGRGSAGETYVIHGGPAGPMGRVGGSPDTDETPPEPAGSSGPSVGLLAGLAAAATTALVALIAGAWYARRRWRR